MELELLNNGKVGFLYNHLFLYLSIGKAFSALPSIRLQKFNIVKAATKENYDKFARQY